MSVHTLEYNAFSVEAHKSVQEFKSPESNLLYNIFDLLLPGIFYLRGPKAWQPQGTVRYVFSFGDTSLLNLL